MTEEKKKPKRAKAVTMTQRSRKYLEKQGYQVALVERSVNAPRFFKGAPTGEVFRNKFDAFGFADLVAVKPDVIGTLYIQTTSADNQAARCQKVFDAKATRAILQSQNRITVHGWRKKGARGQKKTWQVNIFNFRLQGGNQGEIVYETNAIANIEDSGDEEKTLFSEEDDF